MDEPCVEFDEQVCFFTGAPASQGSHDLTEPMDLIVDARLQDVVDDRRLGDDNRSRQ